MCAQRTPQPNRPGPTWLQVINPIWLAGDVCRPEGWGWWAHFWRNPCCNLCSVVLGISHLHRATVTSASPWTYATQGWNRGWSIAAGWRGLFPLPLISCRGFWGPVLRRWGILPYIACERMEAACGWKTSGAFTLAYRRANSPNQDEAP